MDITKAVMGQKMQILSFVIAILVVTGSFFVGWLLTVLSPIFVFLIFKFLKVWKNKERLAYGIPAIIIGVILFFFIFSHQVANVESQQFTMGDLDVKIIGYSSTNFTKPAEVDVVYAHATNASLHYVVNNTITGKVLDSGYVNGTIKNNKTYYSFTVNTTQGIYNVKIMVNNALVYGEIIRENPDQLFKYFIYFSGIYVMAILSILYGLFIFGVHIIRRSKDMMRLRYEEEK